MFDLILQQAVFCKTKKNTNWINVYELVWRQIFGLNSSNIHAYNEKETGGLFGWANIILLIYWVSKVSANEIEYEIIAKKPVANSSIIYLKNVPQCRTVCPF